MIPLVILLGVMSLGGPAPAADGFGAVRDAARGQTVWLNAWGGSPEVNAYVAWAGAETLRRYGVRIEHVKLTDTSEAVTRVAAEQAAGRTKGGAVDLIWINGENFRSMKERGLLFGPFAQHLPGAALIDYAGKPTVLIDFTTPTEGYESPWGMAKFVLLHDTSRLAKPPRTVDAILAYAKANPGRITFPAPPDFIGSTFLKHVLYAKVDDPARLRRPVTEAEFEQLTKGVWAWLEAIRPHLWQGGRSFPANKDALHQLLDDKAVDLSMAFNPAEASSLIAGDRLPASVRTYVLDGGTIANTHFLAIPFNAANKEGAMVVADFLLSPEAQARKQDPKLWGDPTVLDIARLEPADRARFAALELGVATLPPEALGPALLEPDPSWMELLEAGFKRRSAR